MPFFKSFGMRHNRDSADLIGLRAVSSSKKVVWNLFRQFLTGKRSHWDLIKLRDGLVVMWASSGIIFHRNANCLLNKLKSTVGNEGKSVKHRYVKRCDKRSSHSINKAYSPLTAKSGLCFPIPTSYACQKRVPHGMLFALSLGMSPERDLLSSSSNRKVRFAVAANLIFHLQRIRH